MVKFGVPSPYAVEQAAARERFFLESNPPVYVVKGLYVTYYPENSATMHTVVLGDGSWDDESLLRLRCGLPVENDARWTERSKQRWRQERAAWRATHTRPVPLAELDCYEKMQYDEYELLNLRAMQAKWRALVQRMGALLAEMKDLSELGQ
jgi:hypothetical protein